MIDPMADKMLMTIVTICLAVKAAIPGMLLVMGNIEELSGLIRSFGKIYSFSRSHHPRSGCNTGVSRHLHSLHLSPCSKDLRPLLGLQLAERGGPSYRNQQGKYGFAACASGVDYDWNGHWGRFGCMGRRWGTASYVVSSSHFDKFWVWLDHASQKQTMFYTIFVFGTPLLPPKVLLDLSVRTSIFTTQS